MRWGTSPSSTAQPRCDLTYDTIYRSRQTVFAISALSDGEHRLTIRHVGANPAAIGTPALIVDAIDAAALR